MECQHHFDRAYLYTHHVHCHVLGVWVDRQLPAGLITILLSTSMEAAQWSNTNTKFRKSRLK